MKKELKEIFTEILNLGMVLRQDQLRGYSQESGNELLEEYLEENKEKISKILENPFENVSKYSVGETVKFTKSCCEERDINQDSFGRIVELCPLDENRFSYNIFVINGEEEFIDEFFNYELIKL